MKYDTRQGQLYKAVNCDTRVSVELENVRETRKLKFGSSLSPETEVGIYKRKQESK